jgi:DNA-directed RNA polymerase subunit K
MELYSFEKVKVLELRTLQIALGSPIFVKTSKKDPYEIAKEEFSKQKIPFIVIRKYPDGKIEEIKCFK